MAAITTCRSVDTPGAAPPVAASVAIPASSFSAGSLQRYSPYDRPSSPMASSVYFQADAEHRRTRADRRLTEGFDREAVPVALGWPVDPERFYYPEPLIVQGTTSPPRWWISRNALCVPPRACGTTSDARPSETDEKCEIPWNTQPFCIDLIFRHLVLQAINQKCPINNGKRGGTS